jgi:predicted enzyme related to lactoylglutathione lyase
MPEVTSFEPGAFCWIELTTTDEAAAKRFYLPLFGWTNVDSPIPGNGVYVMLKKNGRDVGALYENKNATPAWLSYVWVTNVDESAAKAKSLGGTVLQPPFDVMGIGRMAVVQDPAGAKFALWQAMGPSGIGISNEQGALCWNELTTTDLAGSETFYTSLFGWGAKHGTGGGMEYTELSIGGKGIGGMMAMPKMMEGTPSHWIPYFAVDDADAVANDAKSRGAEIYGPHDIPNVGRFAVIADPQGARFAIIKPG